MNISKSISRRNTLKIFVSAGALTVCMPMIPIFGQEDGQAADTLFDGKLGPFVQINANNTITIGAPVPDMGTGISTTLPMIVANELDADWETIIVEMIPNSHFMDEKNRQVLDYVLQGTGGSGSVTNAWQPLRECGALAKYLILKAAEKDLLISQKDMVTENSYVIVKSSGKKYPYSAFADTAAKIKVPGLKKKTSQWGDYLLRKVDFSETKSGPTIKVQGAGNIVGKPKGQKLARDIVTGNIEFGFDKNFDNQLVAMIERCPHYYGKVKSFDATAALKVNNVVDVIEIPHLGEEGQLKLNSPGVAVIATNIWAAKKGREALKIVWDKGNFSHENNAWHAQEMRDAISRDDVKTLDEKGDVDEALKTSEKIFEREYEVPFWEHFCMEPLSCSAHVMQNEVIIKAGHQFPETIAPYVAKATGVPFENIHVENGRIGGGYGRKATIDFVSEPVFLSQKTGRPVKVYWTREDDVRHGFINSSALYRIKAGVDENGNLKAWDAISSRKGTAWMEGFPEKHVPNSRLKRAYPKIKVPTGAWRGPGHNTTGFVIESMIDEIAVGLNKDPLDYRLEILGVDKEYPFNSWTPVPVKNKTISSARMKGVLRLAAEKAGWGKKMPNGQGRGIASCFTFGSYAAMVVDVFVDDKGNLTVLKVTGAADCGLVINPLGAKAQMEGGCMDGLSAAIYQNIQFDDGRITTGNFNDIPLVRINEAIKAFDFHFVDSNEIPTGLGEIALPPFIPALMNAIYNATGKRIRKFPLGDQLKT
ncbi:MAG: molybdopterin-dependent oxidoreductase [Emcibacter sp.]|nr:molybdopterin-dependent oxidoreductase [Emcibacter sp.]